MPTYEIMKEKRTPSASQRAAAKAGMVYLATDPDREGEAIAWHLQQALDLPDDRVRRVTFHEITERAVKEAFNQSARSTWKWSTPSRPGVSLIGSWDTSSVRCSGRRSPGT